MTQVTRRALVQGMGAAGMLAALPGKLLAEPKGPLWEGRAPLAEFGYDDVEVGGALAVGQRAQVSEVLLGFADDSLLRPLRLMSGVGDQRAASAARSLDGWYSWRPDWDFHHDDAGFAPGSTLGQWTSAMARLSAAAAAGGERMGTVARVAPPVEDGSERPRAEFRLQAGGPRAVRFGGAAQAELLRGRVRRLHAGMRETAGPGYFAQTRFPAYTLDKLICGLVDGRTMAGDTGAWETMGRVVEAARPSLPHRVVERETQWTMGRDPSWMWDESYTMPENLYRAYAAGAGSDYRTMAREYLEDRTFFEPLARGDNALADRHAYSYLNALCSGMQAWLVDGSRMHLDAVLNGFAMVEAQSFASGGWGPDELFRKPGYGQVAASLTKTHNSFEAPCGSYAHLKLMRYLLRVTRDGRYGDSMERVLHSAALGVLPLQPDGRAFYYADYNVAAKKVYSDHRWPCCSGTLPQLAADYGISSYLRAPGELWVVLYGPGAVSWNEGGQRLRLEQETRYPADGEVRLRWSAMTRPVRQRLQLRVPAWAGDATRVRVNGEAMPQRAERGFVTVDRMWHPGDLVEMELPMRLRLEAMPAQWAPMRWGPMDLDTVALVRGPEVLFAVREPTDGAAVLVAKQSALLGAEQVGERTWQVETDRGPRRFMPWTELLTESYSTYVKAV